MARAGQDFGVGRGSAELGRGRARFWADGAAFLGAGFCDIWLVLSR